MGLLGFRRWVAFRFRVCSDLSSLVVMGFGLL
jgi:hypothetical protein